MTMTNDCDQWLWLIVKTMANDYELVSNDYDWWPKMVSEDRSLKKNILGHNLNLKLLEMPLARGTPLNCFLGQKNTNFQKI